MNIEEIATLRETLVELMPQASRASPKKPQRYWYPLSIATYDVEEVLAALDSLCSFQTSMSKKTRAFEERFAAWHDKGAGDGEQWVVGRSAYRLRTGERALRPPRTRRKGAGSMCHLADTDLEPDDGGASAGIRGYRSAIL